MISRLGALCSRVAAQVVPDPFIFALLLTLVTMLLGIVLAQKSPTEMGYYWMNGLWELLPFSMQMVLILVMGGALAHSPPIQWIIRKLAGWPRSGGAAVVIVSSTAMVAALINWGLGLMAGALLARETAESLRDRGIPHHYPLLGAAGYSGLMIWHGGLSGSAPLDAASKTGILFSKIGTIPVSLTTFGGLNLTITLLMLVFSPLILLAMLPRDKTIWEGIDQLKNIAPHNDMGGRNKSIARFLDENPILTIIICLIAFNFLFMYFYHNGLKALNLNSLNAIFLFLGFLFFLRPIRYVQAVSKAAGNAAGIILQFPFYAGIMGMMRDSGLVKIFSDATVGVSNQQTFSIFAFLSAGLVNLFIPSGGGQWAVQGPILVGAASQLHVPHATAVMALAYGDEWTNMLQPFWALPLLAITGLHARKIIGYSTALMILVGPLIILGLMMY